MNATPSPGGLNRPLDLLFVIDPIETLQAGHDTSVALMEAAQSRGHRVSITSVPELGIDGAEAFATCRPLTVTPAVLDQGRWIAAESWFLSGPDQERDVDEFDAVFMRTDPPVDDDYLRATFILDLVDPHSTLMVNSPAGLRNANEKLFGLRVPELGPPTFLSADVSAIVDRVRHWGRAVLKPTDAMGGRGVLVLDPADVNLHSIVEGATDRGRTHVVVQQWIDGAVDGDRRIIVLDGVPVGSVRRVALGDDFRCNMAAGAVTIADEITAADRTLCAALAPHLEEHGIVFAGIDVIGGRLTEVNVTSPTGVREIDALSGSALASDIIAWVESAAVKRVGSDL